MISVLDFTDMTCVNDQIKKRQIINNIEDHFAMYALSKIKTINDIKVDHNENAFIITAPSEECDSIINALALYKVSKFKYTLIPQFTKIDTGLKINFIKVESVI